MDSSNSGSFQSSSGGATGAPDTDEYDSRSQSISSFFNPSTNFNPNNLNHLLQPPQPPTHTSFYNPSTQPFPLQDPGSPWTGTLQDFNTTYPNINTNNNSNSNSSTNTMSMSMDHTKPGHHQIGVSVKNPKKRTRASRRAPTTVLTTDTTNFRQMVQEFTGIPTAPFTTAPFTRRLDLFTRGSDSATGSLNLNPVRPLANKIQQQQPPPFLNSTIESSGTSNNTTTSGNYQFAPSSINTFQKQPSSSTFLDLQNQPMFSFQSLLQNTLPAQQSNDLSGLQKSWRDQNGKMESFEGGIGNNQNIGGSKLNSGMENVLVASRSGGDQVQGNEGSWICPSN